MAKSSSDSCWSKVTGTSAHLEITINEVDRVCNPQGYSFLTVKKHWITDSATPLKLTDL